MNIFNTVRDNEVRDEHWVPIEAAGQSVEQAPLSLLNQRLEAALTDLGRMDYQLSNAIARLRTDITNETHDNLQAHVSQLVEPGLRSAVSALAEEIERARELTAEVIANANNPGRIESLRQQ